MYVYIHIYIHAYMHAYIHTCSVCVRARVPACVCACACACACAYVRTCAGVYIHTSIHAHTHTYVYECGAPRQLLNAWRVSQRRGSAPLSLGEITPRHRLGEWRLRVAIKGVLTPAQRHPCAPKNGRQCVPHKVVVYTHPPPLDTLYNIDR